MSNLQLNDCFPVKVSQSESNQLLRLPISFGWREKTMKKCVFAVFPVKPLPRNSFHCGPPKNQGESRWIKPNQGESRHFQSFFISGLPWVAVFDGLALAAHRRYTMTMSLRTAFSCWRFGTVRVKSWLKTVHLLGTYNEEATQAEADSQVYPVE